MKISVDTILLNLDIIELSFLNEKMNLTLNDSSTLWEKYMDNK